MTDIKTHLGYARAWVRLCLEKKLLYDHLSTLLSEEQLLRFKNEPFKSYNSFKLKHSLCLKDAIQALWIFAL